MWPFKNKKAEYMRKATDDAAQIRAEYVREVTDEAARMAGVLQDFRGIGDSFNYLGVEMTVTGHSRTVQVPHGVSVKPVLACVYVDNIGIIRHIEFEPSLIECLRNISR